MQYYIVFNNFSFISNFIHVTMTVCSRYNEISKRKVLEHLREQCTVYILILQEKKKNFLRAAAVREM